MGNIKKLMLVLACVLVLSMMVSMAATDPLQALTQTLTSICKDIKEMLPIAAMLMIIIAGVIYALGQMMGAETRARANVWATTMFVAAIIAIAIALIVPWAINQFISSSGSGISQLTC